MSSNSRFLEVAELVSTWSKDPSTKIGAVITDSNRRILSTGYNGFPRGFQDSEDRLNDRETKYRYTIHAEMNAIFNAAFNGVPLEGTTIYIHGLPCCTECAKGMIQAGISRVVMNGDRNNPRWKESTDFALSLLEEAGIEYEFV